MDEETWSGLRAQINAFRETNIKEPEPPALWQPPTMEDFLWDCRIQASDQTLTNFGFVRFAIEDGEVVMLDRDTLRPERRPDLITFAEHYELTWSLQKHLMQVLFPHETAIEMPPVHGNRTESILLAGYAIYAAAAECNATPLTMISKNHVGAVLCNDRYASKAQIGEAVCRYIPEAASRKWNEHQRDAAAIGLTRLYDKKRESVSG